MSSKKNIYLVIMAGGSGTRFWPKSTAQLPKQFLSFGQGKNNTLLEKTLSRFDGVVEKTNQCRIIVTTEKLKKPVHDLFSKEQVLVLAEPAGRNTAPCVFWAAKHIEEHDPDGIMLVMPADHHIPDQEKFQKTLLKAIKRASENDEIVTLGVTPTRAETGYGYLKVGKTIIDDCSVVESFVEKPNLEKAKEFLASKKYLWNGGMFVWKVKTILDAYQKYMPEMQKAWSDAKGDVLKAYPNMTATSIDFGVMEKVKNVVTFPLNCGWDDLGSWNSLEGISHELHMNHEIGVVSGGTVVAVDSHDMIVDAPEKLVALLGVKNLIVAQFGNRILVADKERAQDIKLIIEKLKKENPEYL